MVKKFFATTITILLALVCGYYFRICIDQLTARTNGAGAEGLLLIVLPALLILGAVWGRDWALAKYGYARPSKREIKQLQEYRNARVWGGRR